MARSSLLWLFALACAPAPGVPDPSAPMCEVALDCDDPNPCLHPPSCEDGACSPGAPRACDDPGEACVVRDGEALCAPLCPLPIAPVLEVLRPDDALVFVGPGTIETAVLPAGAATSQAVFVASARVPGDVGDGPTRVLARTTDPSCAPDEVFDHVYDLAPGYPGAAGTPTSRAIAASDPRLVGWASGVAHVAYGDGVDPFWREPERALGPASGGSAHVAPLGHGGAITLTFDPPIADGPGFDLAVFENAFSDTFLELAFVEVSSDGSTFARFDAAAHTPAPIGSFGLTQPADVHGFAGVYRQGFGAPFDLAWLRYDPLVRTGQVDVARITHVRIVDVVGDGSTFDSFGRPIHHPYPSAVTAGFDLDAIGVMSQAGR